MCHALFAMRIDFRHRKNEPFIAIPSKRMAATSLGPSVLAMALAIVLFKYFFVIPVYSLAVDIGEAPRLLIFALSVVLVGLLAVAQRGAAESLRRARDQLRRPGRARG